MDPDRRAPRSMSSSPQGLADLPVRHTLVLGPAGLRAPRRPCPATSAAPRRCRPRRAPSGASSAGCWAGTAGPRAPSAAPRRPRPPRRARSTSIRLLCCAELVGPRLVAGLLGRRRPDVRVLDLGPQRLGARACGTGARCRPAARHRPLPRRRRAGPARPSHRRDRRAAPGYRSSLLKVACDAMPAVQVTDLSVRYGRSGDVVAVDGIDLQCRVRRGARHSRSERCRQDVNHRSARGVPPPVRRFAARARARPDGRPQRAHAPNRRDAPARWRLPHARTAPGAHLFARLLPRPA